MSQSQSQSHQSAFDARRYIDSLRALSIEQFAKLYGVGRTRVFEEIAAGRLTTYTVGRRRYVSLAAADQWQRDREVESNAHDGTLTSVGGA